MRLSSFVTLIAISCGSPPAGETNGQTTARHAIEARPHVPDHAPIRADHVVPEAEREAPKVERKDTYVIGVEDRRKLFQSVLDDHVDTLFVRAARGRSGKPLRIARTSLVTEELGLTAAEEPVAIVSQVDARTITLWMRVLSPTEVAVDIGIPVAGYAETTRFAIDDDGEWKVGATYERFDRTQVQAGGLKALLRSNLPAKGVPGGCFGTEPVRYSTLGLAAWVSFRNARKRYDECVPSSDGGWACAASFNAGASYHLRFDMDARARLIADTVTCTYAG
jgi:hypothetical protein